MGPRYWRWRALATERSVSGGTISWWSVKAQMDSEQLLAALRDDSEWPAASLRLLHTTLDPLEEALKGDPALLEIPPASLKKPAPWSSDAFMTNTGPPSSPIGVPAFASSL